MTSFFPTVPSATDCLAKCDPEKLKRTTEIITENLLALSPETNAITFDIPMYPTRDQLREITDKGYGYEVRANTRREDDRVTSHYQMTVFLGSYAPSSFGNFRRSWEWMDRAIDGFGRMLPF